MSAAEALPEPEEPENEQNPHAKSAADQNSVVPLGWKPTASKPVPVVRCVQIKKDGLRCNRWSIRGYTKCFVHSGRGSLENVNKYAAEIIEAGRLRLIDETDAAIDTLHFLMEPGTGEGIRLKAATEVLDRAGIRGGYEVDVAVEEVGSPVDELKKRILELKKGAEARQRMQEGTYDDEDVVEGEVLEDQPALFEFEHPEEGEEDDER